MKYRKYSSGQCTGIEKITGSDGNNNNETRRLTKIASIFINNITSHNYLIQIITEMMKLMKNLIKKVLKPKKLVKQ